MVITKIFLEGGGDSKELHTRCREGFHGLLQKMGFGGRMPRLVSCGGRDQAFKDFRTALASQSSGKWVGLWIDSEEPLADIEASWTHLSLRDSWKRPAGASDEHLLLMVTCMETWLAADRQTLSDHYGRDLRVSALPTLHNLEARPRDEVHGALIRATRNCANAYRKGTRFFVLLGLVDPSVIGRHCPSILRCQRILQAKL